MEKHTIKDAICRFLDTDWGRRLGTEGVEVLETIGTWVSERQSNHTVYPGARQVFRAFEQCPPGKVKVVILGQDPYHGHGQADGLAFSVPDGVSLPPSLRNIYRELAAEYPDHIFPADGNLQSWASQGVLLLNTALTVEEKDPNSHREIWQDFTRLVLKEIDRLEQPVVFMLWGNQAAGYRMFVSENEDRLVLQSPHPSPFSARKGFLGNGHFLAANGFLEDKHLKPIEWIGKD